MWPFKKEPEKRKEPKQLEARLNVGERILIAEEIPFYSLYFRYAGMLNQDIFSLATQENGTGINYYFAICKKEIRLHGVSLEILDVNPDYVHLRYQHHKGK
jgi:hypothetical protein